MSWGRALSRPAPSSDLVPAVTVSRGYHSRPVLGMELASEERVWAPWPPEGP